MLLDEVAGRLEDLTDLIKGKNLTMFSAGTEKKTEAERVEYALKTVYEVETRQIPFEYTIPVLTGVYLQALSPFKGTITEVMMHFPLGCNALVDMAVFLPRREVKRQICPITGFIRLDNSTPVFPLKEPVEDGELIRVEMRNSDGVWVHSPSVTVTITPTEG